VGIDVTVSVGVAVAEESAPFAFDPVFKRADDRCARRRRAGATAS
jgi:hypothetical protein